MPMELVLSHQQANFKILVGLKLLLGRGYPSATLLCMKHCMFLVAECSLSWLYMNHSSMIGGRCMYLLTVAIVLSYTTPLLV